jgi:predicted MFS family arabinose efflux permease
LASPDIVSSFDMTTPFVFMMLMLTLILAWCILGFKETLLVANKDTNSSLKSIVDFLPVFKNQVLIALFIAWTFWNCGWWLFEAYLPTFLQQLWSYEPRDIGNFIGRMGTSYAVVQFLVLYLNTKRNTEDTYKYFLFLAGLSVIGLGFAQEPWHLIASTTLWVIAAAFVLPIFATKFSNSAGADNQGQIMGLMSSVQSISTVLMMLIGGLLFVIGARIPIIVGGVLLVICWGFSFITVNQRSKLSDQQATPATQET